MKKILSRIFSAMLIGATVTSPVLAQTARKATAAQSRTPKATATMKASTTPQKAFGKGKGLHPLTTRSVANGVRAAKSIEALKYSAPAPFKAAGDLPELNGSVIYQNGWESSQEGLYKLPANANQTAELLFSGPDASQGGVCIDDTYYATSYISFWGMVFITVEAYEVSTGELLGSWNPDDFATIALGGATYDSTTGKVYAITYNSAADGVQLSTIEYGDEVVSTAVGALEGNWNTITVDAQGQLYGIKYSGESDADGNYVVTSSELYKIDKATAATTLVGSLGVAPQYISSGTIDKKSGRFFWNLNTADGKSYMCEINLTTGACSTLFEVSTGDEIVGMYAPVPAAEDKAPAQCEDVEVVFPGGGLTGAVELKVPSTCFDGTTLSGNVDVKVFINGEEVASQSAAAGAELSVPVSVTEAGLYNFIVYAQNSVGAGPKTQLKNIFIGKDTPEATTATLVYEDGNMNLTWLPVTAAINGGYLDVDNVRYTVTRFPDEVVVAEEIAVTSFSEAIAEPASITSYYYTVVATCDGLTSAVAKSNTVVLGSIVPPYQADFTNDGLSGWTIIDANEDNKIWTVQSDGSVRMTYNSTLDMDDWLITPPVQMEANKAYELTFQAKAYGSIFPERVEVKFGKGNSVADMTKTLVEPTVLASGDYVDFSVMVTPDESGKFYIGFHGISDPDMFYLYLNNIAIAEGVSALAPGYASNLALTPDANGALKLDVAFDAPSKTMNEQALSSLDKVEVLLNGELAYTFTAPNPGAALSCTLTEGVTNGYNTVTVYGVNAEGNGLKISDEAFVGFEKAAAPENVQLLRSTNEGEVTVSWDAVTKDINGLTLPAGEVYYVVAQYTGSAWEPVSGNLTTTSFTYQAVEAGEQDFVQCAVFPYTSLGQGTGQVADGMLAIGTPYVGLEESFANGTLSYIWGFKAIDGGSVSLYTDEQFNDLASCDGDNGFLGISGSTLDSGADFFSGLISLNGMENPGLSFYVYNIAGEDSDEISVAVKTIEGTTETEFQNVLTSTVNELCGGVEGWGKVNVSLSAYANKTVQVQITGLTKKYVYKLIDLIKVGSLLPYDLKAAGIEAPAKVKAGADYKVSVSVANDGMQTAESFSVKLYCDGELVATKDCSTLEAGSRTAVEFDRTMSAVAEDAVTYYAVVDFAQDQELSNNQTDDAVVAPVVSKFPAAENLGATATDAGVKLTWSEPNLEGGVAQEVTEDFEDADAFSSEYGDWTFVDVDNSEVGGFQGMDLPGITPGATKGSFWIWDQASGIGNQTFDAHSGDKYLFALFRYDDGTTDDWAISPMLYGGAQTISFFAKSYSSSYPEKIEIYYSTTGNDVDDFVKIEDAGADVVPNDWTQYTADLPAGATYFAIRSCATGSFMLMVDDVTYTPAGGSSANLEITGYDVYRDGEKIATVDECEYVDSNVEGNKVYTYTVVVNYTVGAGAPSNSVTVDTSAVANIAAAGLGVKVVDNKIVITNAEGLNVAVSAANGTLVYRGVGEAKTVVEASAGVYVVKAGNTVKKVIIK